MHYINHLENIRNTVKEKETYVKEYLNNSIKRLADGLYEYDSFHDLVFSLKDAGLEEILIKCYNNQLSILNELISTIRLAIKDISDEKPPQHALDLTERTLIIMFLIKYDLFPKYSQRSEKQQKKYIEFLSILFNEKESSVDTAYKTASKIISENKLTSAQVPYRLNNFNNLKNCFELIDCEEISEEIQERIDSLQD